MKNFTKLILAISLVFISCEIEKIDNQENLNGINGKAKKAKQSITTPEKIRECVVMDADRCPFSESQPTANLWWPEVANDFFNPTTYFSSTDIHQLTFTEYDDGTASIIGSTAMGSCAVEVNVWLKDRKSWAEWSAMAGGTQERRLCRRCFQ